MPSFYDEHEIKNARIYDSAGLLYGIASSLLYERDDVYIIVMDESGGRKGMVSSREISLITRGDTSLIIILSRPRELEHRGLPSDYGVPSRLPKPDEIHGLQVVSMERGYLGRVEAIVIGPGTPGIRVSKSSSRSVQWLSFIGSLKKKGRIDEAETLSSIIDPLKSPRISLHDAMNALEEAGLSSLASMLLEFTTRSGDSIDIPFKSVKRITDIVIVE